MVLEFGSTLRLANCSETGVLTEIKDKIIVFSFSKAINQNQMLGCGAHVRKIALPHVRCACGKVFGTVRAMCVRAAGFWE